MVSDARPIVFGLAVPGSKSSFFCAYFYKFFFVFRNFIMICLVWISLDLILLSIIQLVEATGHSVWMMLRLFFNKYFSTPYFFSSSGCLMNSNEY